MRVGCKEAKDCCKTAEPLVVLGHVVQVDAELTQYQDVLHEVDPGQEVYQQVLGC